MVYSRRSGLAVVMTIRAIAKRTQHLQLHRCRLQCLMSTTDDSKARFLQEIEEQRRIEQKNEERKQLIACKIYINAGGHESHVEVMQNLIVRAQMAFTEAATRRRQHQQQKEQQQQKQQQQQQQQQAQSGNSSHQESTSSQIDESTDSSEDNVDTTQSTGMEFTHVGALVNVHFDPESNRSSLHIAGPVMDIIDVAKELIYHATTEFRNRLRGCKMPPNATQRKYVHKLIDIVDHVCFLPLVPFEQSKITDRKRTYPPIWVPTYSAYAARKVGDDIRSKLDLKIFFYDFAQRNNVQYMSVIEQRVKYFSTVNLFPESTFVGACMDYVEDVHILLAAQCGKFRVKELTKLLNNDETGLSDIQATAQLYDVFRWDIHCRLLRPHLTGSNMAAIEQVVKQWNQLQKGRTDQVDREFVLRCYRVGPSYDQCLESLQKVCISDEQRKEHDEEVMKSFHDQAIYYEKLREQEQPQPPVDGIPAEHQYDERDDHDIFDNRSL